LPRSQTQLKTHHSTTGHWTNHSHHIKLVWKVRPISDKKLLSMDITSTTSNSTVMFKHHQRILDLRWRLTVWISVSLKKIQKA
jgi:hypothetical protein